MSQKRGRAGFEKSGKMDTRHRGGKGFEKNGCLRPQKVFIAKTRPKHRANIDF